MIKSEDIVTNFGRKDIDLKKAIKYELVRKIVEGRLKSLDSLDIDSHRCTREEKARTVDDA